MRSRVATAAIFAMLLLIIGVPFLVRPPASERAAVPADRTLIIVTPHVQQIAREFGAAFEAWHQRTYGQEVRVDWRGPIGTTELLKLLQTQYTAAIRRGDIKPDGTCEPGVVTYDLLFGGGSFDHGRVKSGVTVEVGIGADGKPTTVTVPMSAPAGFEQSRLDAWFGVNRVGNQPLYDPKQYWIGTALSAFGIVYNRGIYAKLGLPEPSEFADLCRPELAGWVALADPRQSGSISTTFDAILNNELWAIARSEGWSGALDTALADEARDKSRPWVRALWPEHGPSITAAWDRGWRMLREMCANTRYFTNSSTKPPIDVSQGEAAVGLAIDFYGRGQAQSVSLPGDDPRNSRVGYVDPRGATYIDADPASVLRGGPNPLLARRFIEFCLSDEGQALWEFPATGSPEGASNPRTADGVLIGPSQYMLRRMPVRRAMYEKYRDRFVDKELDPFQSASDTKPAGWRSAIGVMMGAFAIDVGDSQRRAWSALNRARAAAGRSEFPAPDLAEMERLFYAWPPHKLPEDAGATLAFSPENYPRIAASWRDAAFMTRCRIAYTEYFSGCYREVLEIAARHGL